jgi:hypothetical protein
MHVQPQPASRIQSTSPVDNKLHPGFSGCKCLLVTALFIAFAAACCCMHRFYDKAHKLDALDFFKRFAVPPEELPDTVSLQLVLSRLMVCMCTTTMGGVGCRALMTPPTPLLTCKH